MSRIAVGMPTGGHNRWETTWSIWNAAQLIDDFHVAPGIYIAEGRNHLVRWFLEDTDCDKFLSLDSDESFLPEDVAQLDADDLDCVSGIYANVFEGQLKPLCGTLPGRPLAAEPVVEVEWVGAGFVMVTRDLCEKMLAEYGEPVPWFHIPDGRGDHVGEDIGFCRRVREMGVGVHVDQRVQLNHYKTVRIAAGRAAPVPQAGPNRT